jgi:UDP-N-acetyl-2-amino-2-deoxyglucuronate dehydrogenase
MKSKKKKRHNFALIGAGGYIAPRHLRAIKDTGNNLVAVLDPSDSVGILDQYFFDADFFTEFERFDRHAEKLRRLGEKKKIDYVSICSPNYLHDSHIRFALRIGANAICEKPIVLNPWNLDALSEYEEETGKRIFTVLQLRLHPLLINLKNKVQKEWKKGDKKYDIELTYITPRGPWYYNSWKGNIEKSGGIATNIGVHFFDMLIWIFGKLENYEVHYSGSKRVAGYLELEKAKVKWFLSLDKNDLKNERDDENKAFRELVINGKAIEFSDGFSDLHTKVYNDIFAGGGFGIKDVRPSIELIHNIREAVPKIISKTKIHPYLKI